MNIVEGNNTLNVTLIPVSPVWVPPPPVNPPLPSPEPEVEGFYTVIPVGLIEIDPYTGKTVLAYRNGDIYWPAGTLMININPATGKPYVDAFTLKLRRYVAIPQTWYPGITPVNAVTTTEGLPPPNPADNNNAAVYMQHLESLGFILPKTGLGFVDWVSIMTPEQKAKLQALAVQQQSLSNQYQALVRQFDALDYNDPERDVLWAWMEAAAAAGIRADVADRALRNEPGAYEYLFSLKVLP